MTVPRPANAGEATKEMAALIARVKELDAKATAEPWAIAWGGNPPLIVDACGDGDILARVSSGEIIGGERDDDNATLIAEYRTAAPILASEVQRLTDALEKAEKALLFAAGPWRRGEDEAIAAARARRSSTGGG